MSIVGIFTRAQPLIGGVFFDAVLNESTELVTEVTEFPIENGSVGNDHALQRPLRLTMRVGVSDNPFRALREAASSLPGALPGAGRALTGVGAGVAGGAAIGAVGDPAIAGLAVGAANAAFQAGRSQTRGGNALEAIREIQRKNEIIDVVGTKREYAGCIITNTRQETTKENEQGLELVVELQQMLFINSTIDEGGARNPDDTAATQGAETENLGRLNPQ